MSVSHHAGAVPPRNGRPPSYLARAARDGGMRVRRWESRLRRVLGVGGATLAVVAAAGASPAHATDYGPYTCLNGYVWRGAVEGDLVCVTPDVREATAADNANAPSHGTDERSGDRVRLPGTGGGRSLCPDGYVPRQTVPSDLVCVTPSTRAQVVADNAAAASRRNSVRVMHATYYSSAASQTDPCDEEICTTDNSSPIPRIRLGVDHVNVGPVTIGFVWPGGPIPRRTWRATAEPNASAPGGRVVFDTGIAICGGAANAYFLVRDDTSGRVSARHRVHACVPID